jgi:signal transduction histidine kinase
MVLLDLGLPDADGLEAVVRVRATLQRGAGLLADPKLLGRIAAASARATSLVHDLLDLTSVRLGQNLPIRTERIDLGPLVRQAVKEFQAGHPALRIDCAVDGSAIGFFDPARVSQVISNLLRNATQHGDANQPVEVSVAGRSREIELRIRNRGPAIPVELLPHLFKPLRRSTAANAADGSVGLGLFIVNEIARAHGGTVRVTSTECDGTTFVVTLARERPRVCGEALRE